MPIGGISSLFLVDQDPAVSELQHDAEASPGLMGERCPCLGTGGAEQCEEQGGRDGERSKQFQAESPFLRQKTATSVYVFFLFVQCEKILI